MKTKSKLSALVLALIMLIACAVPALIGIGVKANADGLFDDLPDDFFDDFLVLPEDKSEIQFPDRYENEGLDSENPVLFYYSDTTFLQYDERYIFKNFSRYHLIFDDYWLYFMMDYWDEIFSEEVEPFIIVQSAIKEISREMIDALGELRAQGCTVFLFDGFDPDRFEEDGSIQDGEAYVEKNTDYYKQYYMFGKFFTYVIEEIDKSEWNRQIIFGQSLQTSRTYIKDFLYAYCDYYEIPRTELDWLPLYQLLEQHGYEIFYDYGDGNFLNIATGEWIEGQTTYEEESIYANFNRDVRNGALFGITRDNDLDDMFRYFQNEELNGDLPDAVLFQYNYRKDVFYDPNAPKKELWGETKGDYAAGLLDSMEGFLEKWRNKHTSYGG